MATYVSGIDIGHMSIRAVVLVKTAAGWKVHEHGSVARFYGVSGEKSFVQEIAELSTLVQLRGPVYVSDSTMSVMVRFIASVPLPIDRLKRLVRLDLEQHVDDSGDLAADMTILPIGGDDVISCCPLAQPRQVQELLYTLKKNGIKAKAVTIPSAALFNVSRQGFRGDEAYNLLIDVGAVNTQLVIMRGDEFIACRSLSFGGKQFSDALAERHEKSFADAERLKISGLASKAVSAFSKPFNQDDGETKVTESPLFEDEDLPSVSKSKLKRKMEDDLLFNDDELDFGADLDEAAVETSAVTQSISDQKAPVQTSSTTLNFTAFSDASQISSSIHKQVDSNRVAGDSPLVVIEDGVDLEVSRPGMQTMRIGAEQLGDDLVQVAEQLHMHIASSLKWFKSQIHMPQLEIKGYYLCGGTAKLNGLRLYLEHRLSAPVTLHSPLAAIDTDEVQNPATYFSAIGAALQVEERALHFDVRPESIIRKEIWRSEIVWPRLAAGVLLVAGILWAISIHFHQLADAESKQIYDKHEADRKTEMAQLMGLRADRDALFEDIRGIAGRIYAGRDLLNAIRAFKEKAPQDLWIITLTTRGIIDEGPATKDRNTVTQADTAIDRGTVIVTGRVMPDKKADIAKLQQQFQSWYENIAQWEEAPGRNLFKGSKVNKLDVDHEVDQAFVFEVAFDFQPTTLHDVATILHDQENGDIDAP